MAFKLCITGTYCSGKTTLVRDLNAGLPDSRVVPEVIRTVVPWIPFEAWRLPEFRSYLLVEQVLQEARSEREPGCVLVDSGVISNLAHDRLFSITRDPATLSRLGHTPYDLVVLCDHKEVALVNDGFRLTDPVMRETVAGEVESILRSQGTTTVRVRGNPEQRVRQVLRALTEEGPP